MNSRTIRAKSVALKASMQTLTVRASGLMAAARMAMVFLFVFDKRVRSALWAYLKAVFRNPVNLFRRVRTQTILLLQPLDILADGRMNMCDGCPDITVHEGELYWSCRLEEIKEFGCFLTAAPKSRSQAAPRKKFFHEDDAEDPVPELGKAEGEDVSEPEESGDSLPN